MKLCILTTEMFFFFQKVNQNQKIKFNFHNNIRSDGPRSPINRVHIIRFVGPPFHLVQGIVRAITGTRHFHICQNLLRNILLFPICTWISSLHKSQELNWRWTNSQYVLVLMLWYLACVKTTWIRYTTFTWLTRCF